MPKTKPKPETPELEELVEIPFAGVTFVIPRDRDDWSTEAFCWLTEGKYNLFVKYLLERTRAGQWKALCAACPRNRDFGEFFILLAKTIREECTGD